MTATPVFGSGACPVPSRRARAHGVDLLVMRVSMAMLLWARRRADRAQLGRDERAHRHELAVRLQQREHEFALRASRVR